VLPEKRNTDKVGRQSVSSSAIQSSSVHPFHEVDECDTGSHVCKPGTGR
jgi:hypothetical protein